MSARNLVPLSSSAALIFAFAGASSLSVVLPATAFAQQATPDEIVVSARRREESLQEVPLSINVVDEESITRFGINDTDDLIKFSASLQFDEGLGAQDRRIVVRGLSPTRGRSNVAILVDGVDFTGEAVSTAGGGILLNQQLLDVERVEVVKGPQSALYGRSAFGGAIQYISKQPSLDEAEGTMNYQFGTAGGGDNDFRLSGAYGGPVTDDLALRVNGLVYDSDGYYENDLIGQNVGDSEGYGVALSGLWDNGGAVTMSGRLAASSDEYGPQAQARVASNTLIDINDSVAVVTGTPGPGQTNNLVRRSGLVAAIGGTAAYPFCDEAITTPDQDGTITSCLGSPKVLTTGMMPDADQLSIIQSDDPRTGNNYPGTDVDIITGTFNVRYDMDQGEFASYTGFAALDSFQFFDGQIDAIPAGTTSSLDGTYTFTLQPCAYADCSPTKQEVVFENRTRLFSQEFRYASDLDGPLNYTVGALYWQEKVRQLEDGRSVTPAIFRAPIFTFGPPLPPPPIETAPIANDVITSVFNPGSAVVRRDTRSLSFYGLLEWDISETWKASVEARFVSENLDVTGPVCDTVATPILTGLANQTIGGEEFCAQEFRGSSSVGIASGGTLPDGTYTRAVFDSTTASFKDNFIAPKGFIEWLPTDTNIVYFSVGQGIKPGGISTITAGSFFSPNENRFDKEKLLAYELGSKNSFLDGSLVLNGAVYYQDYTDKQVGVSRFDPVIGTDTGSIENAGEAEIWGLELDAIWQITDNLSVSGSYAYTDAEYTDFRFETGSANNVARSLAAGGGGCLEVVPSSGDPSTEPDGQSENCIVDLTGNKIEDVPEHSFVGNLRYIAPLPGSDYDWYGDASFIYVDERFIDEWNTKTLDKYWTVDLRAGLISDQWELILFVDNAFDDDTVKSAVDFGSIVNTTRQGQFPPGPTDGVVVTMPDPRIVGFRANFQF